MKYRMISPSYKDNEIHDIFGIRHVESNLFNGNSISCVELTGDKNPIEIVEIKLDNGYTVRVEGGEITVAYESQNVSATPFKVIVYTNAPQVTPGTSIKEVFVLE